jgi:hypothetical protein
MQSLMSDQTPPTTLTFTYEQSNDFAVKYADGATAKGTPSGNIYVGFFLERPHEFETVVHEMTPEGQLGKEVSRSIKEGICRQIQTAVVMNPAAARVISKLILDTLDKLSPANTTVGIPTGE